MSFVQGQFSGGIFHAIGPGRRRPGLWRALTALAFVGLLALFAHQAGHHRDLDLAGPKDCAVCHFGSALAVGPSIGPQVTLPVNEIGVVAPAPSPADLPSSYRAPAFRSRAPPVVSIA